MLLNPSSVGLLIFCVLGAILGLATPTEAASSAPGQSRPGLTYRIEIRAK